MSVDYNGALNPFLSPTLYQMYLGWIPGAEWCWLNMVMPDWPGTTNDCKESMLAFLANSPQMWHILHFSAGAVLWPFWTKKSQSQMALGGEIVLYEGSAILIGRLSRTRSHQSKTRTRKTMWVKGRLLRVGCGCASHHGKHIPAVHLKIKTEPVDAIHIRNVNGVTSMYWASPDT